MPVPYTQNTLNIHVHNCLAAFLPSHTGVCQIATLAKHLEKPVFRWCIKNCIAIAPMWISLVAICSNTAWQP